MRQNSDTQNEIVGSGRLVPKHIRMDVLHSWRVLGWNLAVGPVKHAGGVIDERQTVIGREELR